MGHITPGVFTLPCPLHKPCALIAVHALLMQVCQVCVLQQSTVASASGMFVTRFLSGFHWAPSAAAVLSDH